MRLECLYYNACTNSLAPGTSLPHFDVTVNRTSKTITDSICGEDSDTKDTIQLTI